MTTIDITIAAPISEQFVADIFTTAIEGGIEYWAEVQSYENAGELTATATIADRETEDEADAAPMVATPATMLKGLRGIFAARTPLIQPRVALRFARAILADDAGEIDADDADNILQIGLLGAIIYG